MMAEEMGKPLAEGRLEIQKCASYCQFIANNAETMLENKVVETAAHESYVHYEPLGPIL